MSWGADRIGDFTEAQFGVNVTEIAKQAKEGADTIEDKTYDSYSTLAEALNELREIFAELATDNKALVIVIDELDRCLPEYTVKVLERVHHLFEDVKNIVLIISTDRQQLGHIIENIFGKNIDTSAYLQKIIHFEVNLDIGQITDEFALRTKFADFLAAFDETLVENKNLPLDEFFDVVFNGIEVRKTIQWLNKVRMVHELTFADEKVGYDVMYYELFWTALTKIHEIYLPQTNSEKINLHKAFNHFRKDNAEDLQWQSLPILKVFADKFDKIHGTGVNEIVSNAVTNYRIQEDYDVLNMMFYYWANGYSNNTLKYSLPRCTPKNQEWLKNYATSNRTKLTQFRNFMDIIS